MINIFDTDNTYDFLWGDKIASTIATLINNALGNHFPTLGVIWLIERYCPKTKPWAEDWTTQAYDFLKPLTRTHLLNNGEVNGSAYGFEPEYTADLPNNLSVADFPDRVTLKVYKGQTVSITWIQRSHEVSSAPYCSQVSNSITCWHREERSYTAPKDEDLEVSLDSSLWLINSCVITGDGLLVGITNAQKELIMYDFFGSTLSDIGSQLKIGNCLVLIRFDATITASCSFYPPISLFQAPKSPITVSMSPKAISFSNALFQEVPDWYYFATLVYAGSGGSKGKNPVVLEGGLISISLSHFGDWADPPTESTTQRMPIETGLEFPFLIPPSFNQFQSIYLINIPTIVSSEISPSPYYSFYNQREPAYIQETASYSLEKFTSGNAVYYADYEFPDLFNTQSSYLVYPTLLAERETNWIENIDEEGQIDQRWTDVTHRVYSLKAGAKIQKTLSLDTGIIHANYNCTFEATTDKQLLEEETITGFVTTPFTYSSTDLSKVTTITREFWTDQLMPYSEMSDFQIQQIANSLDPDPDNGDIMPDSQRVKDLDFRMQQLCDWMGVAQQPDGSIKSYPDPYHHDDLTKLQGYQFAAFSKPENEANPAAIYEVITNRATTDKLGNKLIKQGGFVKTFNYPQMLEQFFFDISKGLGLQESGGIQVTKGDNSGVVTYESQLAIAIDTIRTLSSISKNVNELIVQAGRNVALSQSILAATGVRISTQHIPFDVNGQTMWAEVACIAPGSPSLMDEMLTLELNTAILVGGNLSVQEVS